ncbi:MAG TPA: hypothetical protein VHW64_06940 [Nocardioides sp.]|nr:hypothetical protein [Nocardioides sp.]HEX3930422.1 hypothetical protein [Nocardioides sp.]
MTGTAKSSDHRLLVIGRGGSLARTLQTPAECTAPLVERGAS